MTLSRVFCYYLLIIILISDTAFAIANLLYEICTNNIKHFNDYSP